MIAKAKNQKATVVGWTGPTTAYRATGQFVFDRLLGANSGGNISQEEPFQRPFDMASVYTDMRNEGLGVSPNGAQLTYRTTVELGVIVRPTIETMDIEEYTSTLTIKGLFGFDEGHVRVNDVAAAVTSWSPGIITCIIPETGEGSVGDVVVESPAGVKSNAVPLTEYLIKLNYSADDNGIKLAGVATLRLRADVHKRRSKIGETPTKPTYPDLSPVSGRIFNMKGSSAVYTVTGRKYDACNMTGCRVQFTESPTPKVGSIDFKLPNSKTNFFAMYNWGPEMKTIKLTYLAIAVGDIPLSTEERVNCPDKPEAVIPVEMAYGAWCGFPTTEIDGFITFEIAENYNIRPNSWSKTITRPWSLCNTVGSFKEVISWDVTTPNKEPQDDTSAREAIDVTSN
jgi:hypothetical protein